LNFSDLPLNQVILSALEERGFTTPTEIQVKAIPLLVENDVDFVGQAQTGTGKTAAFSLPLLQKIDSDAKTVQAIILSPTRELANQICDEIAKFSANSKIKTLSVYGGISIDGQLRDLKKKKPQIVVGTPGRVLDLIRRRALKLEDTRFAILDEADEMLDMGFLDDVKEILSNTSEEKNTWMFSATMPRPILDLIKTYLHDPEIVKIKKKTLSNENITQKFYVVNNRDITEAICRLLDATEEYYGIIFTKTKIEAKNLTDELNMRGFLADSLHGDMDQKARDYTMKKFKDKKVMLLVCTDVAARGIDVDHLTHVFNYGLPQDLESYVHRIGRTGRAGQKGMALTVIGPSEVRRIGSLERMTKAKVERCKIPSAEVLKLSMVKRTLNQFDMIFEDLEGNDSMDDSYKVFAEGFDHLDKDRLLKVMFRSLFKDGIKRLDQKPNLDLDQRAKKEGRGGAVVADRHGNIRYFVNAGTDDGLTLENLLIEISNELRIDRRQIRNVQVKDRFSFMDVPASSHETLVDQANVTIGQKRLRFEPTKENKNNRSGGRDFRGGRGGPRAGRSSRGRGNGNGNFRGGNSRGNTTHNARRGHEPHGNR
jgi:ATP-dependent RNA helicase DeaD